MIESADVHNWQQLQNSVCRLLNEVGLSANTEVQLATPRGNVEVDVFAIDERSVDKTRYVVECKNWNTAIPQHVVHSFTTVMHETGANIGFIISKVGLQSGAIQYTNNTNIAGLTYQAFQDRYFSPWWYNHFCVKIAATAHYVCNYTEPFNGLRDEAVSALDDTSFKKFIQLKRKYQVFSMQMYHSDIDTFRPDNRRPLPASIEEYKSKIYQCVGKDFTFESVYWRDLLDEICQSLKKTENELNNIFGRNIFTEI